MATMESQIETQGEKPQIPDQLGHMRNQLNHLEKIIEDLKSRLQPVSRVPTPIDTTAASSKDEEKLVDLAGAIREGTYRISEATNEIVLILQLLEL